MNTYCRSGEDAHICHFSKILKINLKNEAKDCAGIGLPDMLGIIGSKSDPRKPPKYNVFK
jgi:hypothetical protein